jgi:hypothetical protein
MVKIYRIPNWSHDDMQAMRKRANEEAQREVDERFPDTPENSEVRSREFLRRAIHKFREHAEPNYWPRY